MKRSNAAARPIFWLGMMFAIVFLVRAEAGERRTSMPNTKSAPPIRIFDQKGQPAVSGVPSPTGAIFDVTVGGGTGVQFVPDTVNISVGDTVRWTWANSGHSVTSGHPCAADSQFCSPNDTSCFPGVLSNQGTVYQHTFAQSGTYSYFCISHCLLGMTGVVNVTGGCAPSGWSAGPDLPMPGVRAAGVYFQANGKFYAMGGRASDAAGNEFTHPFEYDPVANTWTTKAATYPDNMVNNIACGVLSDAGTPYIYCAGGSVVSTPTVTTGRVFRYNPVTDTISPVAAPWPAAGTTVLPGGFTVFQNKLYILGGFDTVTGGGQGINQIWEFTPAPAGWVQKPTVLPVPLGYIPTTTIGSLIYTGGGSDITAGILTDTTNSFVYNPVANTIGTIAAIPRATGETRALNFNGKMLVMGGGRTAPNPSSEVDAYDPGANSWTVNSPVPAFVNARRNFPTDTDGTTRIWLAGGYDSGGAPTASTERFCQGGGGTPTPTPTASPTPTATPPPTPTPTPTPPPTPTATPSGTPTPTPPPPTPTPTPSGTPTPTPVPTVPPRPSPGPSGTPRGTPPPRP
jgi:plastocyanin